MFPSKSLSGTFSTLLPEQEKKNSSLGEIGKTKKAGKVKKVSKAGKVKKVGEADETSKAGETSKADEAGKINKSQDLKEFIASDVHKTSNLEDQSSKAAIIEQDKPPEDFEENQVNKKNDIPIELKGGDRRTNSKHSELVPSGPVPSGPVPSGPVPSGPVPSGSVPSGPVPTGLTSSKIPTANLDSNLNKNQHNDPMNTPTSNLITEILDLPIWKIQENYAIFTIKIPSPTLIVSVSGISSENQILVPEYVLVSALDFNCSADQWFNFNRDYLFNLGDYCLALAYKNPEKANEVQHLRLEIKYFPISSFLIFQSLTEFFRSFGFEPSHLSYPPRLKSENLSLYLKLQAEFEKLNARMAKLETLIQDHLVTSLSKLAALTELNTLPELANLIPKLKSSLEKIEESLNTQNLYMKERDLYLEKLKEAEDYIDYLTQDLN